MFLFHNSKISRRSGRDSTSAAVGGGSAVSQRFKDSRIQKFKNSKIQKFKN
jgi:hypothetical protein